MSNTYGIINKKMVESKLSSFEEKLDKNMIDSIKKYSDVIVLNDEFDFRVSGGMCDTLLYIKEESSKQIIALPSDISMWHVLYNVIFDYAESLDFKDSLETLKIVNNDNYIYFNKRCIC